MNFISTHSYWLKKIIGETLASKSILIPPSLQFAFLSRSESALSLLSFVVFLATACSARQVGSAKLGKRMAPQVIEAAAGSAAKEFKKESAAARLLGSGKSPLQLNRDAIANVLQVLLVSPNLPFSIQYYPTLKLGPGQHLRYQG